MADRRMPLIPVDKLTAEQKVVYDSIKGGPRANLASFKSAAPGPLAGPFNMMLRSPEIGNIAQSLGGAIRFKSAIPAKLNEFAICITARYWTANYEWHAHARLALEAGLDAAKLKDLAEGRRPSNLDNDEAMVYDFSHELHHSKQVSDANYQRVLDRFGERGVFDLIAVNGYYSLISMVLNVDRAQLPEGVPLPLKPL
ncbi:MAG: carboxymuconolactone decarboxylase family protein [Betaproteobacteria bacterium]|nr:carboxymuconolactone decarboxylase family protein [Betaproteobacteria bacterium]